MSLFGMADIPQVKIAVLGGSTTIGANFPRAYEGVNIIADGLVFDTPFGQTAPFTHAEVDGKEFLYVDFHGINRQVRNTEPNSSGELDSNRKPVVDLVWEPPWDPYVDPTEDARAELGIWT